MTLISLVFLLVYVFGAYAYGSACLVTVGQEKSLWGMHRGYPRTLQRRIDRASLAIFAISTAWFVLHTLIEFRNLTGNRTQGWLDLGTFIAFLFPPVIMHTVYLEAHSDGSTPRRFFRWALPAMYVLSPGVGIWLALSIFKLVPQPTALNATIGIAIGTMFTLASLYSMAVMLRRERRPMTADQAKLRNVMVTLFLALTVVFVILMFLREQRLLVAVLDRISRSAPIYFMIASVYFEDRFAFYDHVVKRALQLMISVGVIGLYLVATLPFVSRLPEGPVLPWLCAVGLAPIAMLMRRVHERTERWLDRKWFGREFTPVEAVKHVLSAMQPAVDEQTLIKTAEERFSEIFSAKIVVLVGSRAIFEDAVDLEIKLTSPVSGSIVRIAVLKDERQRRLLSEDITLLRSLGSVFGFMLENIRLQRKRIEQEQLAQELRLQSSKSELKALRAQINPHFLFNALNAIASLIHTDPGRADEAVEQLAEVFRYTLRRSDSEWAPLDQELTFARAYLDVEQARFGQRLACTIDSDHSAPAPIIPSMLLQTLLENAVKHGVSQQRGPGRIDVIVRSTADRIAIEVRNTGPASRQIASVNAAASQTPRPHTRDGEGFGLHSVRERLKGHFGDRASFSLTRDDAAGVTIARIEMPHVRITA